MTLFFLLNPKNYNNGDAYRKILEGDPYKKRKHRFKESSDNPIESKIGSFLKQDKAIRRGAVKEQLKAKQLLEEQKLQQLATEILKIEEEEAMAILLALDEN